MDTTKPNFYHLRKKIGASQAEVAEKARVSRTAISRAENNDFRYALPEMILPALRTLAAEKGVEIDIPDPVKPIVIRRTIKITTDIAYLSRVWTKEWAEEHAGKTYEATITEKGDAQTEHSKFPHDAFTIINDEETPW